MSDEGAIAELTQMVGERLLGSPRSVIRAEPLQRNFFSLLFTVRGERGTDYVIKIPKTDLRRRPTEGLLPLTNDDLAMGRAEYDSLRFLSERWRGNDVNVHWVRPLVYVDAFNAVVTQRVPAEAALGRYRRLALARAAGSRAAGSDLASSLTRIGTALGRFHRDSDRAGTFSGSALAPRLRRYATALALPRRDLGLAAAFERVVSALDQRHWAAAQTTTLKGLDIRNVLTTEDGAIWLVDPGRMKRTVREADLSRFIMTWRILFWGTPWFPMSVLPHPELEAAFVRGYDAASTHDPSLLNAFLLKEALKHWHTATESLALQPWPDRLRSLVRTIYIEPFYRRQVRVLLGTPR